MIVVQEIIYKREDFPQKGDSFKFKDALYKVVNTKVSLKMKKMYFVNIALEPLLN